MKPILNFSSYTLSALLSVCSLSATAQTHDLAYTGAIQTYTVPAGVTSIGIQLTGGSGGASSTGSFAEAIPAIGGYAAVMYGVFSVTPGQVLKVLVGGAGQTADYCGGGGGGSFVWDNATGTLLIAAGGGGGAGCSDALAVALPGLNANTGDIAINGNTMPTGAGSGGTGGVSNGAYDYAAAGAGWLSSGAGGYNGGASGCGNATSGFTPLTGGAAGSYGGTAGEDGNGGFGGGGGAQGRCGAVGGGGGGGYSGGGAGGELASDNRIYQSGGGGGSYNLGSNQDNEIATDTGNGSAQVRICPSNVTSTAGTSICIGATTTLSANATDGTWSGYGGANVSSTGLVTGETAGTAIIIYKVPNCPGYDELITIVPSPSAGSIAGADNVCAGLSTLLLESVPGGAWSSSSTAVANIGAATGIISGITPGTATITYTVTSSVSGCSATATFPFVVTPPCVSGITAQNGWMPGVEVYPNPNSGAFSIFVSSMLDQDATVVITNILGAKVKEFTMQTNQSTDIQLNTTPGVYFLNAITAHEKWSEKITVTR